MSYICWALSVAKITGELKDLSGEVSLLFCLEPGNVPLSHCFFGVPGFLLRLRSHFRISVLPL